MEAIESGGASMWWENKASRYEWNIMDVYTGWKSAFWDECTALHGWLKKAWTNDRMRSNGLRRCTRWNSSDCFPGDRMSSHVFLAYNGSICEPSGWMSLMSIYRSMVLIKMYERQQSWNLSVLLWCLNQYISNPSCVITTETDLKVGWVSYCGVLSSVMKGKNYLRIQT